jgi:hypothetical protein
MNEPVLLRVLDGLIAVRDHVVLVGGTAHRLFPLHPLGAEPSHELLSTEDIDFAAPLELGHSGAGDLVASLAKVGFEEEVGGAERACHRYRFEGGRETVQFIAPLVGSGERRGGSPDRRLVFSGIVAEKLRHVDVLLRAPWRLRVDEHVSVLVADPVGFLVQKLLILPARSPAKRGKDVLYVFDTLSVFADRLDDLATAGEPTRAGLTVRQSKALHQSFARHFTELGDAAREAEVIARHQRADPPDARTIVRACRLGLSTLLPELGT